jgi:lipoprotein signal peptidase
MDTSADFETVRSATCAGMQRKDVIPAVFAILSLVLVDQVSKMGAMSCVPSVTVALAHATIGLGGHIHQPGHYPILEYIIVLCVIVLTWTLPIANSVKVLWTATALSNHVEMLLQSGTFDFIALRLGNRVIIANIADFYFAAGFIVLAVTMTRQVRAELTAAQLRNSRSQVAMAA